MGHARTANVEALRLLTIKEAAPLLSLSEPALRRLIQGGHIPVVRLSARRLRIHIADLAAFIETNRSGQE